MPHLHLALALGGPQPSSLAFLSHLAREAEASLLDFVTVEVLGRDRAAQFGAVLVATHLAACTRALGLVPAVHVGQSAPARIALAVDVLHRISGGRAGVQLHVPVPGDEQGWVSAVQRHWAAERTGAGVRGEPVVALPGRPACDQRDLRAVADIGFVAPRSPAEAERLVTSASGDGKASRMLLGDVVVVLDERSESAVARAAQVVSATAPQGTTVFAGTPAELADLAQDWQAAGLAGLRVHPADPVVDLRAITRGLVPELQRRGIFRRSYVGSGLRDNLVLGDRPVAHRATCSPSESSDAA